MALHTKLLLLHGGAGGLRDPTLLQSALARPKQHFTYATSVDMAGLGSLYTAGIVHNHPFVDGNKRTGFVVGILFIERNGYHFGATEESAVAHVLRLAAGEIDEIEYAAFLRSNSVKSKRRV